MICKIEGLAKGVKSMVWMKDLQGNFHEVNWVMAKLKENAQGWGQVSDHEMKEEQRKKNAVLPSDTYLQSQREAVLRQKNKRGDEERRRQDRLARSNEELNLNSQAVVHQIIQTGILLDDTPSSSHSSSSSHNSSCHDSSSHSSYDHSSHSSYDFGSSSDCSSSGDF